MIALLFLTMKSESYIIVMHTFYNTFCREMSQDEPDTRPAVMRTPKAKYVFVHSCFLRILTFCIRRSKGGNASPLASPLSPSPV